MAAECWFRNPHSYIRECAELLVPNVAWDRGTLRKYNVDPNKHIELYYPSEVDYRILVIGDQGAAEVRRGRSLRNPVAVYPVWAHGLDSLTALEKMLAEPVGLSESVCRSATGPADERPVLGQEHRVVITSMPNATLKASRTLLHHIVDLQEEYPKAIVHYHNPTTFNLAFGLGLRSGDIDVRTPASKGTVMLACGKMVTFEEAADYPVWVRLTGMSLSSLSVPRNRCLFNMRSALWAADHWGEDVKFAVTPSHSGGKNSLPTQISGKPYGNLKPLSGDKFHCNSCSLQRKCRYYRYNGVCSVPDSEPSALARFFNTRDCDRIIDGLGALMAKNAERAEFGIANEEEEGKLDPEVTKIINTLFDNGVKLAKLINPALAGGSATFVQVNQGSSLTPNALMAGIIAEFEQKGISRGNITPEMIHALLPPAGVIDVEP